MSTRLRMQRCLWMALYLQRYGRITFDVARGSLGISMRTYRRCLADLREAGIILETRMRVPSHGNGELNSKGTYFVAFDHIMAPLRKDAA